MAYLSRIFVYPIKALDGVALTEAIVLKSGALERDRQLAIFDSRGNFVNGKRNSKVHLLRTSFDFDSGTVGLQIQGSEQTEVFHIDKERVELEAWLSQYFGFQVELRQDLVTGFPDDPDASGPTIISTGTIETVASWFPGVSNDEMRRRLRTNIEIAGVPPFWEDRLFAQMGDLVEFQVGQVLFVGINPCQRCVVPTRDSWSGEVYPNFQKIFVEKRKETIPTWAHTSRFNHFYRLSLNTRIPESELGKILQVGDEVNHVSDLR